MFARIFSLLLLSASGLYAQPMCPCPTVTPTTTPTAAPTPAPAAACLQIVKSGYLYKPESQGTGDARQGKPMVLFTDAARDGQVLKVFNTNGKQICKFGRFAAERYYSGVPSGCGLNATELKKKAIATSGAKVVFVRLSESDGLMRCIRIKDPEDRQDNR